MGGREAWDSHKEKLIVHTRKVRSDNTFEEMELDIGPILMEHRQNMETATYTSPNMQLAT